MARPRRNAARAQDSLLKTDEVIEIPVEEQPYPLPKGWKWVRLGDITEIVGGGTPSSRVKEYYDNGNIPWLSPADLSDYHEIYICRGKKMLTVKGLNSSSARMMPAETVCLSSRAPIGYVVIAKNPLCTNQGFKSFLPSRLYIPKFLYWYLKGNKPLLESYASGTTFLELSGSKASQIEFPLPPLDEQQRIVDRIESLFAKLDDAKTKAEAVLEGFEIRKAAILHKAFTGELTHVIPSNFLPITNFISKEKNSIKAGPFGSALKKDFYVSSGYKIYGQEQVISGDENFGDYFINEEKYQELKSCKVAPGDVLISLVGTVGKILILSDKCKPGIINPRLIKVTLDKKKMTQKFFKYYFQSDEVKASYTERSHGTTMDVMNMSILKQLNFPCFTITEQREIVRILDKLLANERQIREATETVLHQIDLMKKAILARAFRGELGTHGSARNGPQNN